MTARPDFSDLVVLAGLVMLAAGLYMLFGVGVSLVVVGALFVSFGFFLAWNKAVAKSADPGRAKDA